VRRHPRRVQILELGHFSFFFIVLCRDLLVSHGEARESNRKGGEMSRKLTLTEAERKSLAWLKAEYSTVNGQCVEIASTTDKDKIAIRRSCSVLFSTALGTGSSTASSADQSFNRSMLVAGRGAGLPFAPLPARPDRPIAEHHQLSGSAFTPMA